MGRTTAYSRRIARHSRVRQNLSGTAERPRLAVFRSLNHIYAQVIDDVAGVTVAAAGSTESEVRSQSDRQAQGRLSAIVGTLVAQRAAEKGVGSVVFDRGGYKYHGRVKALADAARKGGLTF